MTEVRKQQSKFYSFIHPKMLTNYHVFPPMRNRNTSKYKIDKFFVLMDPTFQPTSLMISQEIGIINGSIPWGILSTFAGAKIKFPLKLYWPSQVDCGAARGLVQRRLVSVEVLLKSQAQQILAF